MVGLRVCLGGEDKNFNGTIDSGETDPCKIDSDGDGIQDGTEAGLTLAEIVIDTNAGVFIPDSDPTTTTDPTKEDTDGLELNWGDHGVVIRLLEKMATRLLFLVVAGVLVQMS